MIRGGIPSFLFLLLFCLTVFLLGVSLGQNVRATSEGMTDTIAPLYTLGDSAEGIASDEDEGRGDEYEVMEAPVPSVEEELTVGGSTGQEEIRFPEEGGLAADESDLTLGGSDGFTLGESKVPTLGASDGVVGSRVKYSRYIPVLIAFFLCWQGGKFIFRCLLEAAR